MTLSETSIGIQVVIGYRSKEQEMVVINDTHPAWPKWVATAKQVMEHLERDDSSLTFVEARINGPWSEAQLSWVHKG